MLPSVLANDTDAQNQALTAAVVAGPANGTLALNPNGTFSYTPNLNFNGPDSFTYRAFDGVAQSAATTVTINVAAVNDAPVGVADSYTVGEDSTLNTTLGMPAGVLANDTDVDQVRHRLRYTRWLPRPMARRRPGSTARSPTPRTRTSVARTRSPIVLLMA